MEDNILEWQLKGVKFMAITIKMLIFVIYGGD